MPAGIQILNDYGTILVDDQNPSMSLRTKLNISSGVNSTFNITGEIPTVAIHTATQYLKGASYTQQSGYRLYSVGSEKTELGPPPAFNATAYHFDRPVDSGIKAGLKIYDSAGRLTFDALGKYARVAGVLTGYGSQVFYGSPGRTYACVVLASVYVDELIVSRFGSHRIRQQWVTGYRQDGANVIMRDVRLNDIEYPSSETPFRFQRGSEPKLLILDVTGY